MRMSRRLLLHQLTAVAALPALPRLAMAQAYPIRPARIIVATSAGGTTGNGATGHVSGELFKMMSGVKMVHVPYRGESLALTDLIGGQVQVVFATIGSSIQYIKGGQLRALAITTAVRSDVLPDVPPLADV